MKKLFVLILTLALIAAALSGERTELQCAAFVKCHKAPKGSKVTSQDMMSISDLEKLVGVTLFPNVPNAPKSSYKASDWDL